MITIKDTELPEGNIADVWDSYKYFGVPPANINHEVTARKSAKANTYI